MPTMRVCYDERFIEEERSKVQCPATGDSLRRYGVFHEDGTLLCRFVIPASQEITRWLLIDSAKRAERQDLRRRRIASRFGLAA